MCKKRNQPWFHDNEIDKQNDEKNLKNMLHNERQKELSTLLFTDKKCITVEKAERMSMPDYASQ
jgi:hypothetical protein